MRAPDAADAQSGASGGKEVGRTERLRGGQSSELPDEAAVYGQRLPLANGIFLTRGAFEGPNWGIDVCICQNVYEPHRAAASRASWRQELHVR
jgi:hypothetical protein